MEATKKQNPGPPNFENIAKAFLNFENPNKQERELILSLSILLAQSYSMGFEVGAASLFSITPFRLN